MTLAGLSLRAPAPRRPAPAVRVVAAGLSLRRPAVILSGGQA